VQPDMREAWNRYWSRICWFRATFGYIWRNLHGHVVFSNLDM